MRSCLQDIADELRRIKREERKVQRDKAKDTEIERAETRVKGEEPQVDTPPNVRLNNPGRRRQKGEKRDIAYSPSNTREVYVHPEANYSRKHSIRGVKGTGSNIPESDHEAESEAFFFFLYGE